DKAARIAKQGSRRYLAAKPQMKRHHRALTETDQREARGIESDTAEFAINEGMEVGRCLHGIIVEFRIACGALADPAEAAILRLMQPVRRDEGNIRHGALPIVREGHQVRPV